MADLGSTASGTLHVLRDGHPLCGTTGRLVATRSPFGKLPSAVADCRRCRDAACHTCGGTGNQTGCPYCDDPEQADYHTMCFRAEWVCPTCHGTGRRGR